MPFSLIRPLSCLSMLLMLHAPSAALAAQARPYLNWPGKPTQAQGQTTQVPPELPRLEKALPNAATGQPGFDIPPSPYGQVGDPYRRELGWPGKAVPATPPTESNPSPQASASSATQSRFEPPRFGTPEPIGPEVRYASKPQPQTQLQGAPKTASTPVKTQPELTASAPRRVTDAVPEARYTAPAPMIAPPLPDQKTAAKTPQAAPQMPPQPAPKTATPNTAATAMATATPADSGYRLPPNSKYAGRVSPELEGRQTTPKTTEPMTTAPKPAVTADARKADPKKTTTDKTTADKATAPVSDAPLAQAAEQESADPYTPFVPGSHATNASQAPRFYSLHRAYGLEPDPVTHTGGDLSLDAGAVQTKDATKDVSGAAAKKTEPKKTDPSSSTPATSDKSS